jgi:hypothetical protein
MVSVLPAPVIPLLVLYPSMAFMFRFLRRIDTVLFFLFFHHGQSAMSPAHSSQLYDDP